MHAISIYKITKIVRTLWLAERRGCMRVCNHGCDVTVSVSPAHFKAVSLTLKYKYSGIQKKNNFPSFDLEIDHLFSSEPRKESKREEQQRLC